MAQLATQLGPSITITNTFQAFFQPFPSGISLRYPSVAARVERTNQGVTIATTTWQANQERARFTVRQSDD